MAEKKRKTQAEKAVNAAKSKSASKNQTASTGKNAKPEVKKESAIPVRFITSVVFLVLFAVLLAIFLGTDGAFPSTVENVILGLVGYVGFIVAIPGFLYLFFIHAFSGKRPVIMRSVCLAVFILVCGCLSHLSMYTALDAKGFEFVKALYVGGINRTTGGLICGALTVLLREFCGNGLSYLLLIVTAVLTLGSAFGGVFFAQKKWRAEHFVGE